MIRRPRIDENLVKNFFKQKAGFLWTNMLSCEIKRTKNITNFYRFLQIRNCMDFLGYDFLSIFFFSNAYETVIQTLWN